MIGTRGLMSAAFFCGQAYIVLVLQERWGYCAGQAGIALTVRRHRLGPRQPGPGAAR